MSDSLSFTFHNHFGYKTWMARIDGSDSQYGLSRSFLRRETTSSRSGKSGDTKFSIDEPGLYEVGGNKHDNGFRLCWVKDGALAWNHCSDDRRDAIISLLDDGASFEEARLATRKSAS